MRRALIVALLGGALSAWGCAKNNGGGGCRLNSDCAAGQKCVEGTCQGVVADRDGDGIPDSQDNCPTTVNPDQADRDHDGIGDACDPDNDNDGVPDETDNCPLVANPDQADEDHDGIGDACDNDRDGDGVPNSVDNCPDTPNASQADRDGDGIGDVCDPDVDGDGVPNNVDNCPTVANPNQTDTNGDGTGDACEGVHDRDGDGIPDSVDNCPDVANPEQTDSDLDGMGDACDPPTLRRTGGPVNSSCAFTPPVSQFVPTPKWSWPLATDTISYPTKVQVMSTPMVANLNDDNGDGVVDTNDTPDIIFISFDTTEPAGADPNDPTLYHPIDGVLRAVDGATGKTLWTAGGPGEYLAPASSVAVGDLDGDGVPEIVALRANGDGLIAFHADGSLDWNCADLGNCFSTGSWFNWGGVAIANLDQSGNPEVFYGNHIVRYDGTSWPILNADGTPRDTSSDGSGDNFVNPDPAYHVGALSAAIDLDGDGSYPEILAGRTVYRYDPTLDAFIVDQPITDNIAASIADTLAGDTYSSTFYSGTSTPADSQDGYPAAANFDDDPALEIVLVLDGHVLLLDDDGTELDNMLLPTDPNASSAYEGAGGPPTIADFDGDGKPEIGVAGQSAYTVFDVNPDPVKTLALSVLWWSPIDETSSSRTGSSVFDFDADGHAEVVYNDEQSLHIYRYYAGTTPPSGYSGCSNHLCIWKQPNTSFTAYEYPVIADVDNDGNAEVVVASNDFGRTTDANATHGIHVFQDADDNWVPTRRIWNEHTYHISNVNEDGTIPRVEDASLSSNSFRKNFQGTGNTPDLRAPDATASDSIVAPGCNKGQVQVGVWVQNQGALQLPPGVVVALFDGDPTAGGTLLGTASTTSNLLPGDSQLVVFSLVPAATAWDVYAVVDYAPSGGGNNECDESNNTLHIGPVGC